MGEVGRLIANKFPALLTPSATEMAAHDIIEPIAIPTSPVNVSPSSASAAAAAAAASSTASASNSSSSTALSTTATTTTPVRQQNGEIQNGGNAAQDVRNNSETEQMDVDPNSDDDDSQISTSESGGGGSSSVAAGSGVENSQSQNPAASTQSPAKQQLTDPTASTSLNSKSLCVPELSNHSEVSQDKTTNDDSASQDSNAANNCVKESEGARGETEGDDSNMSCTKRNGSSNDRDTEEDESQDAAISEAPTSKDGDGGDDEDDEDDEHELDDDKSQSSGTANDGERALKLTGDAAVLKSAASEDPLKADPLDVHKNQATSTTSTAADETKLNGEASQREKLNDEGIVDLDDDDSDEEDVKAVDKVGVASKNEDEQHITSVNSSPQTIVMAVATAVPHLSNDSDGAVIIGSDSENDDEHMNNQLQQSSSSPARKPQVRELVYDDDDDDDCVVIEDDDTPPPALSAEAKRKSSVNVKDFASFGTDGVDGSDEYQPSSKRQRVSITAPMQLASNNQQSIAQITIKDARSLMPQQQQQQQLLQRDGKESSLLMLDARTAEANRQLQAMPPSNAANIYPVVIRPASGAAPPGNQNNAAIMQQQQMSSPCGPPKLAPVSGSMPVQQSPTAASHIPALPTISNANLLPGLTDDMFVLEAPSFIVPYIYEKPPTDNLREIVNEIETKFDFKKEDLTEDDNDNLDMMSEQNKDKKKRKRRFGAEEPDDSWSESEQDDDDEDDEDSDAEVRTKILIKEASNDLNALKAAIKPPLSVVSSSPVAAAADVTQLNAAAKGSENYFESPLGKFFMDIGVGLIQEFVQADLLRLQKRKLRRSMGKNVTAFERAIAALSGNLEASKKRNLPFKFTVKRCEFCNFKSESALAMANHYESPHMNGVMFRCNFCPFEIRNSTEIIYHMEAMHNIKARLNKQLPYHQCPNCGFEDNGKAKLARHQPVCAKKFRPEINLVPPHDWEAPAKIPRIKPRHGLVGTATAYQAMTAQAAAQKAALASIQQQQQQVQHARTLQAAALAAQNSAAAASNANKMQNRGRPQTVTRISPNGGGTVLRGTNQVRPQLPSGMMPTNYHFTGTQLIQTASAAANNKSKSVTSAGQPSISITPLPRQSQSSGAQTQNHQQQSQHQQQQQQQSASAAAAGKMPQAGMKPGQNAGGAAGANNKAQFVICEICDGYIKDLEQLRNHMQWMHKVKIHPKMIYNRPPLNCQKCQFRFFTDQGLERHLLGSHGLVTSSMQEAANKGKDAGRCPVCGRMYQWKLLNHVSRDHHMTLKPAHLSYKCTVCTATFGMYKQFETHVYTAHSTVAKKAMDGKKNNNNSGGGGGGGNGNNNAGGSRLSVVNDSLLKPLKINDEITIIPQPSTKSRLSNMESHVIELS